MAGLLNGYASAAGPSFEHRNSDESVAWNHGCSDAQWLADLVGLVGGWLVRCLVAGWLPAWLVACRNMKLTSINISCNDRLCL